MKASLTVTSKKPIALLEQAGCLGNDEKGFCNIISTLTEFS